jgi:hypothetical protein
MAAAFWLLYTVFMYGYNSVAVQRCPLCGEPVSWGERQAGLYACLTVCVPLIPYPQHLIQKHRDYLAAAKKAARPVFYTAFFLSSFRRRAGGIWFSRSRCVSCSCLGYRICNWVD